jgi:transcriptional regulator with XRE-family HTH domain
MDRRITAAIFRERLGIVMKRSGLSQTDFAKALKIDRSSLVQLLAPATDRLPRVETLALIASLGNVSLDWLLGIGRQVQAEADVGIDSLLIEQNAPSPVDERLMRWHREAAGYKIRHVPLTFPDVLKTEDVIAFEHRKSVVPHPDAPPEDMGSRLAYLRRPETDFEVCNSIQQIAAFVRGQGVWQGLSAQRRRSQLNRLIELSEELYPTFRWFFYDESQVFSVPITIFGPLRAALYTGQGYLVFTAPKHVQALARHFDSLVRMAVVQPSGAPAHLRSLLAEIEAE